MKPIQKARLGMQIIFAVLTATAILINTSALKIIILATTVLGGVYYCGWACSFGFAQDLAGKLGRKLGMKREQVPESIHSVALYMRYILFVIVSVITTDFMFQLLGYEPRGAFLGLLSGMVPSISALIIIGIFVLLSMKYERVYCRYLCPQGAIYGLISLLRPFTLKRDHATCINCGKCDRSCPMQINVSKASKLRSPQCVNCFECASACPVKGALTYGLAFKKEKQ